MEHQTTHFATYFEYRCQWGCGRCPVVSGIHGRGAEPLCPGDRVLCTAAAGGSVA